jgi:hypothetical protein
MTYDLAIIGGGLSGLLAAARAEARGASVLLVDSGVPGTIGSLGGFAQFSGAKFSLFPAGSGLAPLVGGEDQLVDLYRAMCSLFASLGFQKFIVTEEELLGKESSPEEDLAYRRYHSIVLSPDEIDALLIALTKRLHTTKIMRKKVTSLEIGSAPPFGVVLDDGSRAASRAIIVAAGRLGANLLKNAGVKESAGKGIDIGIRLDFSSCVPVAGLRCLGPDAKFIADGVRTFCLNSPGKIFHYPGLGYSVPGGVVAPGGWKASNVGVLCRLKDRAAAIDHLAKHAPDGFKQMTCSGHERDLGWDATSRNVLTDQVVRRLGGFVARLAQSGLVDLPRSYTIHYPLLDWHWPVFSLLGNLETNVPGVFAAGDVSGHARGLMQAAVMGELAAEEALG